MKEFLVLIGLLSCSYIYCQKTIDSLQTENPLLNIGKRITKKNNFEPWKYEYRAYQYLPAQKDSIQFDGVPFGEVIVTVNKHRKIKNLSFRRYYSEVDSNSLIKILNKDFDTMANWISKKYLCEKYGSILEYGDPRVWNEATRWMVEKRKIQLIKSFGQKRNQNKLFNSLELKIY